MACDGDDGVALPPSKRVRVDGEYAPDKTELDARCVSALPGNARWSVAVLCDPALFRFITSFQSGFHKRLLDLERENGVTPEAKRKARKEREKMARYGLDLFQNRDSPDVSRALAMTRQADRSMTDLVIETNDQRSLEMVYELRQQEELRKHPRCRFYHALRAAAQFGRVEMLEWLSQLKEGEEWLTDPWLLDAAIQSKAIAAVEWVLGNYRGSEEAVIRTKTLDTVAENGALDVLKLILERFPTTRLTTDAMDGAAEKGHLDMVKYLHETRTEGCTSVAMDNAAMNGHLDVVKWLHENRTEGCTTDAMNSAAEKRHLDVVKWLHEHRGEGCTIRSIENSASNGHLEVIRYLHETCQQRLTSGILINGMKHIDIVRYVLDHGGPDSWSLNDMDDACGTSFELTKLFHENGNGHLDVVRFLHDHRDEGCTSRAMDQAASNVHLEIVRFLHENREEGCSEAALSNACKHGHFEVVKFLLANRPDALFIPPALEGAAFNNHMEILQFLVENALKGETKEIPDAALSAAAGNGHLEVVEYLIQVSEKPCPEAVLKKAAFEGHFHVVKYVYPLVECSSSTLVDIVEGIAANGQYDVLSYLLQQNPEIDDANGSSAIEEAAELGYLEVIQLLLDRHPEFFNTDAFSSAISNGRLGILKLLHERFEQRKSEWLEDGEDEVMEYEVEGLNDLVQLMIEVAAGNGHFEVVQWLFRHYPHSFEMEAVEHAASGGHIDIVRFLLDHTPLQITDETLWNAIGNNRLSVVKFLLENCGSSLNHDSAIMDEAAEKGYYDMVKYLHEHSPEKFSASAMDIAAAEGHFDVVRFLHTNRTEGCTTQAMDEAAANNHFDMLQFLHDNRTEGCTTRAMDSAAAHGDTEIVSFLHNYRTEGCTTAAMDHAAIGNGHLNIVKFLHKNRTEGCTTLAMDMAASKGHLHVVKFLHENLIQGCTILAMTNAIYHGRVQVVKFLKENRPEGFVDSVLDQAERAYTPEIGRILKYLDPERPIDRQSRIERIKMYEKDLGRRAQQRFFSWLDGEHGEEEADQGSERDLDVAGNEVE
ncbi:hypothetical protein Poli38472_010206 [Pythium oligandrum]|uniref:Uncharacterized protein n=1 Tax=Pythium oligandrum TaxID=41045 RepID=A0A8K1C9Z5_PYTOL|nr:hypothetical protein Poli38472_010206 [Pythium oligandrum]|eukprot:TMW58647.1 hypothetical protein Poli38472_010206 [Pythium oligandrum]